MTEDRNQYQIIRKDARNCFVESLNDAFGIGKVHFVFASYDLSKPTGHRQTNNIPIYIAIAEFLELCRKLEGGELRGLMRNRKEQGSDEPIYRSLGGTSAEKLKQQGRARPDGKSLSRCIQLICGNKSEFLLVADSGPGITNDKGLIVPKFGNTPENHVAVSMTYEMFSELLLMTKAHYGAWLGSYYLQKVLSGELQTAPRSTSAEASSESDEESEYEPEAMF